MLKNVTTKRSSKEYLDTCTTLIPIIAFAAILALHGNANGDAKKYVAKMVENVVSALNTKDLL